MISSRETVFLYPMEIDYLQSAGKQLAYYKVLGEKTFAQLEDADLFWQYNPESNSIAVIVNHLSGNMKSRWSDFLNSDGEKPWRQRDREFEDVISTRQALLTAWNEGWDCVFTALNSVNTDNFHTDIYIRNQRHSIVEAVNRQLMHYAYHIGQIVYIGRMIRGEAWQSLSIPKGKSQAFNANKFSQGKHGGHFTDEIK